jgi:hypothetical protein
VQRPQVKIVFLTLMLTTASFSVAAGPPGAAVSGVVRGADGTAQMGALVQVVGGNSATAGMAVTDLHGRYVIDHLVPGKYQVRASAALFIPSMRGNLQLRSGAQAVVNLTLSTLFETAAWLPAERRRVDEPSDDWRLTLRSAANRPILRWDEDGDVTTVSPKESKASEAPREVASVMAGDGGFGRGGVHTVFAMSRSADRRAQGANGSNGASGAQMTMRADLGAANSSGEPSTEIATGYERQLGFAGDSRMVVSYQSHPEMVGSDGTVGLQAMQFANAQRMSLGDTVDLEVGSTVYVMRTSGFVNASQPFLKVTVHPSAAWRVGYRMATAQNLQSFGGLDSLQQELPVAVMYQGRLQTERGMHQELAVGRKVGPGLIQVAYYRDSMDRVMVSGGGALSPEDVAQADPSGENGVITDSSTGNFRFLNAGYKTQGVNVTLTEPLSQSMWVALEYSTGAALAAKDGAAPMTSTTPTTAFAGLNPMAAQTATLALKGKVVQTGTTVRTVYRWEPSRMVTAIDPYAAFGDQAFLSCYLRQAIRFGKHLPPGLDATVDITNLLAQGYRPFLSADGSTLFLAQSPRTIQAGLAFSF